MKYVKLFGLLNVVVVAVMACAGISERGDGHFSP